MEKNRNFSELAHAVRSSQGRNSVVDLVYNEETGQFVPSFDKVHPEGTIVTKMANDGYA